MEDDPEGFSICAREVSKREGSHLMRFFKHGGSLEGMQMARGLPIKAASLGKL